MKPDWKDAPEWANWLAMDESGEWYWYDMAPDTGSCSWVSLGRSCSAGVGERWEDTLTKRPDYL
jgi:hypothetical protein